MATVTNHWKVEYARFILYPPPAPPSHSSIVPISSYARKLGNGGKWIPSSSLLSLKLRNHPNRDDFILSITLRNKILEEHYASWLMFSWPQVSCVSGFPARGARTVFVSYKDSVGQIQKFILRFLTIYEIENFMRVLEGKLEPASPPAPPPTCIEFDSAISSQSEFNPLDGVSHRDEEGLICAAWGQSSPPPLQLTMAPELSQDLRTEEMRLNRAAEDILSDFPPSFTSFLMNCCTEVQQAAASPSSTTQEVDLKDQIAKYLKDASFQDMLVKVEKIIHELGDNM